MKHRLADPVFYCILVGDGASVGSMVRYFSYWTFDPRNREATFDLGAGRVAIYLMLRGDCSPAHARANGGRDQKHAGQVQQAYHAPLGVYA